LGDIAMNRLEVIAMFTSLKALSKNKLYDDLDNVIDKTLEAALNEKPNAKRKESEDSDKD
jgi:formaldehyde-activating enzyme involved in methanogenesis